MSPRAFDRLRLTLARVRLFLVRYRAVYWTLAVSLALAAGWSVHRQQSQAATAQAAWGEGEQVLVLTRAVPAGTELDEDDITTLDAPAALVPHSRMTDLRGGVVARVALGEGTILVDEVVIEPGTGLGDEHRGVALPVTAGMPPLHPGQPVELVGPAGSVATDARVLSVGDDQVVIAVPRSDLTAVTTAAHVDELTVVLTGTHS